MRTHCSLRLHVLHHESILDLALHARRSTTCSTSHSRSHDASGLRWNNMGLFRASSDVKDKWQDHHGNWCSGIPYWGHTFDFHQERYQLLEVAIPGIVHNRDWRRLPVYCFKCKSRHFYYRLPFLTSYLITALHLQTNACTSVSCRRSSSNSYAPLPIIGSIDYSRYIWLRSPDTPRSR
jgi:hypothetical protein